MELEQIFSSSDLDVALLAKKAQMLTVALKEGNITETEYKELVEDLVDIRKISQLADSVERKALLNEVFRVLRLFLSKG